MRATPEAVAPEPVAPARERRRVGVARLPEGVSVRAATPADVPAVRAIVDAAFTPYVERLNRLPTSLSADIDAAVQARTVLVAGADGGLVGALIADLVPGADAYIATVAVMPHARNRGVGQAMIAEAERLARRSGFARVTLRTNAAYGLEAYYLRLGYNRVPSPADALPGQLHFARTLGPAIATRAAVDALYGRRRVHGHGVDPATARYAIDLSAPADLAALMPGARAVRLEVGFGGGEHLLDHARRTPDVLVLGVEPFETGMRRMVRAMEAEGVANVRVHLGDARRVLDWLPPGSLDRVDVLYPDPWPKQRHWKRRFVSTDGLDRLARTLRPGGEVRVASDIPAYVNWTRAHVAAHPLFVLEADAGEPWPAWPGTRYEAKALREGRTPRYLTLRRR